MMSDNVLVIKNCLKASFVEGALTQLITLLIEIVRDFMAKSSASPTHTRAYYIYGMRNFAWSRNHDHDLSWLL